MAVQHTFGQDLTVSASGDLAQVTGTVAGQERIIRRLMTNPQADVFHPEYGAGLPAFVGQPMAAAAITAIIRQQMQLEAVVAQTPAPSVTVTGSNNGVVVASVQYVDNTTGQTSILTLPLS